MPSSHPYVVRPSSLWCVWISDRWRPPIRTLAASGGQWRLGVPTGVEHPAGRTQRRVWRQSQHDGGAARIAGRNCWEFPISVRSLRCWLSTSRRDKSPSCTARRLAKSQRGSDSTGRRTQSLTNLAVTRTAQRIRSTSFPKVSGRSSNSCGSATWVVGTSLWMTERRGPRSARYRLGVPRMRRRGSRADVFSWSERCGHQPTWTVRGG